MTQRQQSAYGIIKAIAVFLVSAVVAYTTIKINLEQNTEMLNAHESKLTVMDKRVRAVEDCIVEQKVHNAWTKETLTRIERKVESQ